MGALSEAMQTEGPRHLWTLCEETLSGFADEGLTPIFLQYAEGSYESAGPVCAQVTPCNGVRFRVEST